MDHHQQYLAKKPRSGTTATPTPGVRFSETA
jgi:hypothetical protein